MILASQQTPQKDEWNAQLSIFSFAACLSNCVALITVKTLQNKCLNFLWLKEDYKSQKGNSVPLKMLNDQL